MTSSETAVVPPEPSKLAQTSRVLLGESAQAVPRLALSPNEAAATLGVSRDYFDEHIRPELRIVRRGRLILIAVRELQRWLAESAALTLAGERE